MSSHNLCLFLVLLYLLAVPAAASYAGDRPLETVLHQELDGGYIFSTGNSTYSGPLEKDTRYKVAFDITLPDDTGVIYQRLYVYWAWSGLDQRPVLPDITFRGPEGSGLNLSNRYSDSKGFAGRNDFFSGMDAYETTPLSPGRNTLIFSVENTAADNRSLVVQGMGLLTVYSSEEGKHAVCWVQEGADLLYSSHGITPEMATAKMLFENCPDTGKVNSAHLRLVAPSGGYSMTDLPEKNSLAFNRGGESVLPSFIEAIIEKIFPGYNGKKWTDVFDSDEINQIGVDKRDVIAYLRTGDNTASVSDNKDYLQLTNALLWAEVSE